MQGQVTILRDGNERNLSVRVSAEQTSQSRDSYIITLDDITELVSAQRTSAWGDVARRIAHEIKNPLTPIQLSAERIRRKFGKTITEPKDKSIFEQCTDTIVRQVDDIRRMVDEFSRFARMPKPVIEGEDVADTVRQAVFLMKVAHPELDIEADIKQDPLHAQFDRRLISQALTNIIKNATEAIEQVPPRNSARRTARVVSMSSPQRENDDIVIDVIDNGIGLPKVSPPAAARTLCHHTRKGHRPWARHRRPRARRPWRQDRAERRRRLPAGPARGLDAAAICRHRPQQIQNRGPGPAAEQPAAGDAKRQATAAAETKARRGNQWAGRSD